MRIPWPNWLKIAQNLVVPTRLRVTPQFHAKVCYSQDAGSNNTCIPVYQNALKHGDRLAIIDEAGGHTYSSLYRRAAALAGDIRSSAVGESSEARGTKFTFLTPNSSAYVVAQWAIWMAGGVCVPLCPAHPLDTLRYYLEDSGARLTLATPDMEHKVSGLPGDLLIFEGHREAHDEVGKIHSSVQTSDPAMILYTSGTTGLPKGVVLSHGNLQSQAGCLIDAWKWRPEDRLLHVLPLHHTHGIVNCLLCPLTVGATVRMLPKFDPAKVFETIMNKEVNLLMAVPTIYAKLLQHADTSNHLTSKDITKAAEDIRLMVSGSAALPTPVLHAWKQLTGHTLLERYGMTEIGMALSNPLEEEGRVPGAVGSPLPGVKARIVRWTESGDEVLAEAESGSVSADTSQEGELLISGPNVFQEYLNKPEATKKEFTSDGWFKTGDTAKIENGVFKILGRTSVDIIKSGGYKISALDVERLLLTHPDIQDVAVVGVEDLTWGQKVAAVVVLSGENTSLSLDDMRTWCSQRMAKYWIPTELRILDEMPRNVMGKVNKKDLLKTIFTN